MDRNCKVQEYIAHITFDNVQQEVLLEVKSQEEQKILLRKRKQNYLTATKFKISMKDL